MTEGYSVCPTMIFQYNHTSTVYKVNETIKLSCELTTEENPNTSMFYLTHYGWEKMLDPSYVVGKQVVFEIEKAEVDADGQYNCYYGDCDYPGWLSFMTIHVIDQTKPQLECMTANVYNHSSYNLTCRWSRSDDRYSSCWLLQFASRSLLTGDLQPFQDCGGITTTVESCQGPYQYASTCSVILDDFLHTYEYKIRLYENLFLGGKNNTAEFDYTIPADDSVVKLRPVEPHVSAESSRQLTLTLMFDGCSVDIKQKTDIEFHISYWSGWDPSYIQVDNFALKSCSSMQTTRIIKNLEPFTNYTFSIRIKLSTSPHWSDSSVLEGRTLPEAPVDIPKSIAYSQVHAEEGESQRKLFLYWEPLQPRYWFGPSFYYIVSINCTNQSEWKEEFTPTVYTAELSQLLPSTSSCDVRLQSKNSLGISEERSTSNIPPFTKDKKPDSVQVAELGQNVYKIVVMDTSSRSKDMVYALYWCQGYLKSDTPICMENYYSQLSEGMNFTIALNQSNPHYNWFFGASVIENTQPSSVLWDSNQSDVVSSGPVAREPDDDQKIGIIIGICGGFVAASLALLAICRFYPKLKEWLKIVYIPDIVEKTVSNGSTVNRLEKADTDSDSCNTSDESYGLVRHKQYDKNTIKLQNDSSFSSPLQSEGHPENAMGYTSISDIQHPEVKKNDLENITNAVNYMGHDTEGVYICGQDPTDKNSDGVELPHVNNSDNIKALSISTLAPTESERSCNDLSILIGVSALDSARYERLVSTGSRDTENQFTFLSSTCQGNSLTGIQPSVEKTNHYSSSNSPHIPLDKTVTKATEPIFLKQNQKIGSEEGQVAKDPDENAMAETSLTCIEWKQNGLKKKNTLELVVDETIEAHKCEQNFTYKNGKDAENSEVYDIDYSKVHIDKTVRKIPREIQSSVPDFSQLERSAADGAIMTENLDTFQGNSSQDFSQNVSQGIKDPASNEIPYQAPEAHGYTSISDIQRLTELKQSNTLVYTTDAYECEQSLTNKDSIDETSPISESCSYSKAYLSNTLINIPDSSQPERLVAREASVADNPDIIPNDTPTSQDEIQTVIQMPLDNSRQYTCAPDESPNKRHDQIS